MAAAAQQVYTRLGDLLPDISLPGDIAALTVQALCIDSRRLQRGDVFVALRGHSADGRDFIDAAVAAGAAAVLAEADAGGIGTAGGVAVVKVPQLSARLSAMAGRLYGRPSQKMRVVGVTGTNGKTTCSLLAAQLETLLGHSGASLGTLGYGLAADAELTGSELTTPDAVSVQRLLSQLQQRGARAVAMEVSSHSLSQARVAGVDFEVAIFTNLTRDHLDYHGDMRRYGEAKRKLFEMPGLRHAVINLDDDFGRHMLQSLQGPRLWSYSIGGGRADVQALQPLYSARGVEAQVISPWGEGRLRSPLLGEFNLSNLLAVITAACVQGASFAEVMSLLPQLKPVVGRMQRIDIDSDIDVVIDYAHTPDALQQALASLRAGVDGALWCVFGCGGDRDKGKRAPMGAVAERLADRLVITSDNPRGEEPLAIIGDIEAGLTGASLVQIEPDRAAAIELAVTRAPAGACVLIAGKGHEQYQQVGSRRLPFSDLVQARLGLRQRNKGDKGKDETEVTL